MTLLERTPVLTQLAALLADAGSGHGHVVFLGGEAGVGKTRVVQELCLMATATARVAVGECDPLSTPRPLGPLLDMAGALGGTQAAGLAGSREQLYPTLLATLNRGARPTLLVFEDVHWADEATLDVLRFLGRRIEASRALLLATYRDDELGPRHPLRVLLGDLATSGRVRRVALSPLSAVGVSQLAEGSGLDAAHLYRQTGGNPFFVTEVLAAGGTRIPATVRDAVLGRVARLPAASQAVLAAAAVIGPPVDAWLLARVVGAEMDAVEACVHGGVLRAQGDGYAFGHELARQAVLDSLTPHRQRVIHALVLDALRTAPGRPPEPARLAHHAEAAGDGPAVLEYAHRAALQAASLGAHREAAAQYARALRFANGVPADVRTALLEAYAAECALIDHLQEAISARQQAAALWQEGGDALKVGENLCHLAGLHLHAGHNVQGEADIRAALDVLRPLPEGATHAHAYQVQAHIRMLDRDYAEAARWGARALTLAEELRHLPIMIGAYNTLGTVDVLSSGCERGDELLRRSLRLARDAGLDDRVAAAYTNLGSGHGEMYRFAQADVALRDGMAFSRERDLDARRLYMEAWFALSQLHQGRWAEAALAAGAVLAQPRAATISRIMALVALGRVRARRGDPDVRAALDEARTLATVTATLQRLGPVHAARAEAAWLAGDAASAAREAQVPYALALDHQHPWFVGELAYWQRKAGERLEVPACAARPLRPATPGGLGGRRRGLAGPRLPVRGGAGPGRQ